MAVKLIGCSTSTRRKLVSILLSILIFSLSAGASAFAAGHPLTSSVATAIFVGTAVGLFEEFYFQTPRGAWLRSMQPLRSICIYTLVVIVIFLVAVHLSHLLLGRLDELPDIYRHLPLAIAVFVIFGVAGILAIRVIHFVGAETLFHLMVGTYHRAVTEGRALMFIDINESTALAERLGALKTRSLVGKFLFDISKPITDHGGEIYLYKGDGLIAIWGSAEAARDCSLLQAIDAIFARMGHEKGEFRRQFGMVPTFRIGVHGGDVVVSEQGDDKRSIGIYGDTINIAARMEDAAKKHGVACVISEAIVIMLNISNDSRLIRLGEEQVRGISVPIHIYEYRPAYGAARPADDRYALTH
jgi:class 3 adenylate cyclase